MEVVKLLVSEPFVCAESRATLCALLHNPLPSDDVSPQSVVFDTHRERRQQGWYLPKVCPAAAQSRLTRATMQVFRGLTRAHVVDGFEQRLGCAGHIQLHGNAPLPES